MRRVRRRGGNKEKVFGCDLLEHLTASSQELPQVLRCCSAFVEQHGVVDGIYRLSGVSSNIQKLRGEFENDGNPDLNKDVYLQDIHCVSSLCKAYFRELPNPLLTYQLYDKFAEAVAIQLEEERLVKIRDVLKELPKAHYRTLEFLMRHLVTMASHSSETNMHARNLAIVWAPNLLRSKDIEATGFNGTAAFMEVRVQSIVVEFILTHVPQLFPEQGASAERRNSLPSPSALSSPGEPMFKCVPPPANFGNISPGDGPLPIRPYHAIIEGTDKRKGSLKGKKWMSIFNIGGRFPDPRKKHKHSAKEKDLTPLRPARSMDSLSTPLYPKEGSRRSAQRPPSTSTSPLVTNSPKSGSDAAGPAGGIGVSEYAVTYRRGTGLVSGGAGTQGTYTALDPEGLGGAGNESVQTRSPGLSNKAGRRAAMHITGPTIVTVPLHITSNLALGVLQGGGSDRVIHRGRDKEGGERGESKEAGEKADERIERKVEGDVKAAEKRKPPRRKDRGGVVAVEGSTLLVCGGGEDREEAKEEQEVTEECGEKPELVVRSVSREQRVKSHHSSTNDDEYMDMKELEAVALQSEDDAFDASDVLNSTEAEGDDHELSGYVQDNFEFLDQMDCSALDHMDCSTSYQINEFSVEPPGHSDDEYELMSQHLAERMPGPEAHTHNPNELNPHRPLSLDLNNRYTKSLSLPHMTSPVRGPEEEPCSEDEDLGDNSDDVDYSSEEDESMFYKSLPADLFLNFELDAQPQESCTVDRPPAESSEDGEAEPLHEEEAAATDEQMGEEKDEDGLEDKQMMEKEEEDTLDAGGDPPEQSRTAEECLSVMEDTQSDGEKAAQFAEFPPPPDEGVQVEVEAADDPHSDCSPHHADCCATQENGDLSEPRDFPVQETNNDDEEDRKENGESEATSQDIVLEKNENHQDICDEPSEEDKEVITDKKHDEEGQEGDKQLDRVICRTGSEIWEELEDVICEVIEDEEMGDVGKEGSDDKISEVEEDGTNKTDVRIEVEKEAMAEADEVTEPEMQQESVENETYSSETGEGEEVVQESQDFNDEPQHQREEVASEEPEPENNDEEKPDEQHVPKEVRPSVKESQEGRKCVDGDITPGGVGRKLVVSKSPKVCLAKAVPVVPPKPHHCKITALTLRQQQQQQLRERRDAENTLRVTMEQDKAGERRRDGDEGAARDANRNSPHSMCFDEAVAIATMRRGKEKVCEKEKERQREWGSEAQ